jgi:hypothetical protein
LQWCKSQQGRTWRELPVCFAIICGPAEYWKPGCRDSLQRVDAMRMERCTLTCKMILMANPQHMIVVFFTSFEPFSISMAFKTK